jgi:PleD family two-component response regulator
MSLTSAEWGPSALEEIMRGKNLSEKNGKANILVIDDSAGILEMLERGLHDEFNVIALSQPEKALDMVQSDDIDLVISDIMIVPVSGFEILRG